MRLLYARSRIAQATVVFVAAVVAFTFLGRASAAESLGWLLLLCAVAGWRVAESARFSRRSPAPTEAKRWARRFVVGSALTGAGWGAAAFLFYPHAPLAHEIFLAFAIGGMCAGAASSDASHPPAFGAYVVPALLPLVVLFLASGDSIHVAMGVMTAVFGAATGLISISGGRAIREATRMRFQNERLLQQLAQEREQLAYVVEGTSDGYWDWDLRTGSVALSRRYAEILGLPRGIRGSRRAWEELLHPEDAERAKAGLDAHLAGGTDRYEAEYRLRAGDGSWKWVRSRGRVVERDGQGTPLRMAGMLSDVDAAHREQERRLDEARLSGLVRRVNEIELLVRRDGSIAEVNDRALEAYGYTRRELLGLNIRDLRAPETLAELPGQWADASANEGARFETRHLRRDGTTFPVEVSARRLEAGEEVYLHSLVRDLTQQRAAERSLRESQEKLLEATRLASLGTLAAGVAHEINNPLSWMRSSLSYALEQLGEGEAEPAPGIAPAELRELLGDALQGVRRIGGIVRAMQSLARPPEGEQAREVDARAELAEAIDAVGDELAEKATVSVDLPQGLPLVRAVPGELGRAFQHVLVNAAHAIPAGRAAENRIAVAARASGGELVIEIADSGQGMTAEVRERIFEPFFTTKPVGQGSGLGLAIARSVVLAVGGRIEVESEVGRGSAFRMHLPAAARAALPEGDAAPVAPAGSSRGNLVS